MPLSTQQVILRSLAKYLVIVPFITVVGLIDSLIHLFVPYKYEDPELPDKNAVLSEAVDKSDPHSPFRSTMTSDLMRIDDPNANLYDAMATSVSQFGDMPTMGVRECFSIDDEKQPNGKVFKKFSLGSYQWATYANIYERVNHFSAGLAKLGLKSGDNMVLFAETRPEWIISAFGCFRIGAPIVTLYSTLGIDALAFGIGQTDASFLITSGEQLGKVEKILSKVPKLAHIIVLCDKFTEANVTKFRMAVAGKINVVTGKELEQLGADSPLDEKAYKKPGKNDVAVIMYTSGSTGAPKGVMISHGNLLTATRALISRLGTMNRKKDIYVAYLPLAHVFELVCEITCMTHGLRLAYSTPQTIADNSTAIKKGQKGDLRVLKPTIMAAVPIVLERLSKTVYEKLAQTSWFKQLLFKVAYQKKLRYFRAGRNSRLLDRILFKRISSAVLGGKVRLMLSGGAMLSKEVHEFVQVCLCPVLQAYGLTETCGAGTTQLPNQATPEIVGSVVACCEIKLVDWPEGGYRVTDKPNPRGEIYIGGDNITLGYYNMPEKTKEDYSYSKDGIRYFATGDIGEMLPNGNLKIIDRKKDLVKLQGGEYVSLNKVESVIKLLSFVDNCCVIADPSKPNCVVLVCPNLKRICEYIQEAEKENGGNGVSVSANLNSSSSSTDLSTSNADKSASGDEIRKPADVFKYLEENPSLVNKLVQEMSTMCLQQGIDRFEIPTRMGFVKEPWVPESGLVTDSLKLKRREIEKFYKKDIERLYK